MHAIIVPAPSALRMFCVAALFDDNVLVYNVATVRAEPDWGVVAPVIQVRTPLPSHFGYLPPPKAVFGRNWKQNEDPCGLGARFPLAGRLLRVELPDLFLCLAAQESELHPDRAIIYPLYRAGRPDGPVAEGEAEVQDQLGPERDRLLRGEERPCSPEFGDPPSRAEHGL